MLVLRFVKGEEEIKLHDFQLSEIKKFPLIIITIILQRTNLTVGIAGAANLTTVADQIDVHGVKCRWITYRCQ